MRAAGQPQQGGLQEQQEQQHGRGARPNAEPELPRGKKPVVTPQNNQEGPSTAWHMAAGKPHHRGARRGVGIAGRAASVPAGEGASNLSLPHNQGSQSPPSSSSRLGHAAHHCIHRCHPLGLVERLARSGELRPCQGRGSGGKQDPRVSFEQGALGKHHVRGAGGREVAEPRCKQQARFTEAAERAARPRRGGESSGLPALPWHRTNPVSTPPAWPRTPGSDAGLLLCATRLMLTPCNT